MFNDILNKKKQEKDEQCNDIKEKISKMNLSEMRVYVNDNLKSFALSECGLREIMSRLVSKDSASKRFIESDAMDSKIKKAFELVLLIASSKKMTVATTKLIENFISLYGDLIMKFDTDNRQIYDSKLKNSLILAIENVAKISVYKNKREILER
ncbi:MAG: hypothetical protein U9P72_01220 [Campylobacterota bacterium]|nr:hypothetical protein [Campylobacterota bacterium]